MTYFPYLINENFIRMQFLDMVFNYHLCIGNCINYCYYIGLPDASKSNFIEIIGFTNAFELRWVSSTPFGILFRLPVQF